jgi:hypothetical protein
MDYTNGTNKHEPRLVNNSPTIDHTKIKDEEEVEVKRHPGAGRNYNLESDSSE